MAVRQTDFPISEVTKGRSGTCIPIPRTEAAGLCIQVCERRELHPPAYSDAVVSGPLVYAGLRMRRASQSKAVLLMSNVLYWFFQSCQPVPHRTPSQRAKSFSTTSLFPPYPVVPSTSAACTITACRLHHTSPTNPCRRTPLPPPLLVITVPAVHYRPSAASVLRQTTARPSPVSTAAATPTTRSVCSPSWPCTMTTSTSHRPSPHRQSRLQTATKWTKTTTCGITRHNRWTTVRPCQIPIIIIYGLSK